MREGDAQKWRRRTIELDETDKLVPIQYEDGTEDHSTTPLQKFGVLYMEKGPWTRAMSENHLEIRDSFAKLDNWLCKLDIEERCLRIVREHIETAQMFAVRGSWIAAKEKARVDSDLAAAARISQRRIRSDAELLADYGTGEPTASDLEEKEERDGQ